MARTNHLIILALTVLSLTSLPAIALDLDLSLKEESALTRLTNEDKVTIKSVAKTALEKGQDGSSHVWSNPKTGHAGVITIISSHQESKGLCREIRLINTAEELTSTTVVTLCKHDEKWAESSHRDTSTERNQIDTSMTIEDSNVSEMKAKTISQTSEKCQQLSQDIERLKGKPQQRSTVMTQYELECQRIPN